MQTEEKTEDLKEDLKDKAEDLISHAGDYIQTFYKLTLVKLTQKATDITSGLLAALVAIVLGTFVIFFASIGLAWWVGDLIESRAGGFLIVAGFYLLVLLCIVLMRKKIIFPYFRDMIIRKFYD
jgi:hypothetical protein